MDEDFNQFAATFLSPPSAPRVPVVAVEELRVTTRSYGFPSSGLLKKADEQEDVTPRPPSPPPPPTCCLYPASQLGRLYTADDLPDRIFGGYPDSANLVFIKVGNHYEAAYAGTTYTITAETSDTDSDGLEWVQNGIANSLYPCLISGHIADYFPDTLHVHRPETGGIDEPAHRAGLCDWYITSPVYGVRYNTLTCKWQAGLFTTGPGATGTAYNKIGNQNTPVGNYEGGITVT